MTDLLKELDAVALLAEKATPGMFIVDAYGDVQANGEDVARIASSGDLADHDARVVAAAVNFIRTHHAEITEAVEEAAYGRALKAAMEVEYRQAKESSLRHHGRQQQWLTIYSTLRRLKVAANHLCDDAHNSAREVGE